MPLPAELLRPYRVVLTDPGPRPVATTKIIYELTKLDLKRANQLTRHPPSIVATFDTREDAAWLQNAFHDVGALTVLEETRAL